MDKNHYQILGIPRDATEEQIKKAYKTKALIFHPDKNKSPGAQEHFKVIKRAYEILIDTNTRRQYDYSQRSSSAKSPSSTSNKTFEQKNKRSSSSSTSKNSSFGKNQSQGSGSRSTPGKPKSSGGSKNGRHFFGAAGSPNTKPSQSQGSSFDRNEGTARAEPLNKDAEINHQLFVTMDELAKGCTKNMKITRNIIEKDGKRRKVAKILTVTVHAGWKTGTKITFPEEGDLDLQSKRIPADIVFIVTLKPRSNSSSSNDKKSEKATNQRTPRKTEQNNNCTSIDKKPEETFEGLNLRSELLRGVHAMGFTSPTYVQDKCLATLLRSVPLNIIARTESKTGKIAAFCIAALNKVIESMNETQVVILAPTHDLVLRIVAILKEVGKFCENTTILTATQEEACTNLFTKNGKISAHIVVGTPGSIFGAHSHKRFDVSKIRLLVVDDVDTILNTAGIFAQHSKLIRLVSKRAKKLVFCSSKIASENLALSGWFPGATVVQLK